MTDSEFSHVSFGHHTLDGSSGPGESQRQAGEIDIASEYGDLINRLEAARSAFIGAERYTEEHQRALSDLLAQSERVFEEIPVLRLAKEKINRIVEPYLGRIEYGKLRSEGGYDLRKEYDFIARKSFYHAVYEFYCEYAGLESTGSLVLDYNTRTGIWYWKNPFADLHPEWTMPEGGTEDIDTALAVFDRIVQAIPEYRLWRCRKYIAAGESVDEVAPYSAVGVYATEEEINELHSNPGGTRISPSEE